MDTLTHAECVDLVRGPGRTRTALVAVDGAGPVPLACVVVGGGNVVVPTGRDTSLIRAAAGRPVEIEFADGGWTITGLGLARPLEPDDRPLAPRRTGPVALGSSFDNGILVLIARLAGHRVTAPDIPRQREGEDLPVRPPAPR